MLQRPFLVMTLAFGSCLLLLAPSLMAQDETEKELGWSYAAELSLVFTGGNAETETIGGRFGAFHDWEDARFALELGGLRAESTTTTRTATGTLDNFRVSERDNTELTAETLFLHTRYDRNISERLFWYLGADWDRNELAGYDSRLVGVAGVGHVWFDTETAHFRTDYGLTYTLQDDLVEDPDLDDGFIGIRLGYDYGRQLSPSTVFDSTLVVDTNLDESEDVRADFLNALAVSMNDSLALKVSLQLLYDNLPALTAVPLTGPGVPAGTTVSTPLDDLDSIFTVALVYTR